jgi:hypothetical protein
MESELIKKVIQITDVSLEERKISVFDENKKKYSIWRTKKDGTPTKAIQAFEPYAMQATGKSFEIMHDEKPVPDNANAFYRTIMTIRPSTMSATASQPITVDSTNLEERVKTLEMALNVMKGRLDQLSPDTALKTANTAPQEQSTEELAKSLGGIPKINQYGQQENPISVDEIPF